MLNTVNSPGLSKSKKVEVTNSPGATSTDIVEKIDNILENQPKPLIVHHCGKSVQIGSFF